jgi:hypothetical protein
MLIVWQAYALLDTAFHFKTDKSRNFKGIKQFRQLRQDMKSCLKGIATRLKAIIEEMAKAGKAKLKLEGILPLKQFDQVGQFRRSNHSPSSYHQF